MNVSNNTFAPSSCQTFTGRAAIIKEADKICRSVNTKFPHISPYLCWHQIKNPEKHYNIFLPLWDKLDKMRDAIYDTDTAYDYYDVLIKKIKKNKCANCDDLSDIVYLKCKNKNYEDVRLIQLNGFDPVTKKRVKYDHVAVEFTYKNRKIVIDPLFGIADFASNCILKYKTIFRRFIDDFDENLRLVLLKSDDVKIHPDDLKDLTEKYKGLIG